MRAPYRSPRFLTVAAATAAAVSVGALAVLWSSNRSSDVASGERDGRSVTAAPVIPATRLPVASPRLARLVFVGDAMLGRNVEGLTDRFGPDYPFAQLTDRFARADAVVLNLEGPIVEQHRRTPTGSTSFSFPPAVADTLARHHVGLVTLANNHTLDRGAAGFAETSRHLAAAGVSAFGHPRDIAAANVVRRDVGGTSFTFVGFNDVFGVLDDERATALLVDLATREPERFLVVAIHWGDEYVLTHNRRQEQLAHRFVDAGVDLVVGHHPHVVQDVEVYRERLVFYSLGNFIFDQYFSPQTQEGLLVTLDVGSGQAAYQLTPVALPRSQPAPLTGEAASGWLSALSQRSAPAVRAAVAAGTVTVPWPPSNDWP